MSEEELVEVELLSTDPSAVAAVRQTMQGLKGGDLLERDGRFFVPAGFPAWAAERQGYVKRLMPSAPSGPGQHGDDRASQDPEPDQGGRPPPR